MSDELYQQAIVALAKAAHGAGKLDSAKRRATIDNPLCGDRATVEIILANGRVAALRHSVKGCLLCKAAASVLGLRAPNQPREAVLANAAAVEAMLDAGRPLPAVAWPELAAFLPVQRHKSRFDCVKLPFQAARQALGN
ncbi:MAG: iron-sulfur cluster assembly scaffold protein [Rhodospirillales bacterium]